MWKLAILLTLYSVLMEITNCTSSYDQRQNGNFNVQIGLKNLKIIALLKGAKEEYVDYDYAYDYSEMTIKPPNGTTITPLNASSTVMNIEIQQTANSTPIALQDQSTEINTFNVTVMDVTTEKTVNKPQTTTLVATTAKPTDVPPAPTTMLPEVESDSTETSSIAPNKCRRGFVPNNDGKCEYKVHGTSNALRRIVKLAQKIKIEREISGE